MHLRDAIGFTAKNLTVVNFCSTDYEYPGDANKNLTKRSNVITQAVALQEAGDKHVYKNVALRGRLGTMFLRTTRAWFKNVVPAAHMPLAHSFVSSSVSARYQVELARTAETDLGEIWIYNR